MTQRLINSSGGMLAVNLDTRNAAGKAEAIILAPRERSRALSEEEMRSREIRKLLDRGDLREVPAPVPTKRQESARREEVSASLLPKPEPEKKEPKKAKD